jgi:hypothetical protein
MKTIKLTPAQYLKQIELGYIIPVKCLSVFKKPVLLLGLTSTEELIIDLK